MAQQQAPIVCKNVLPWRGCEKLYLDVRTADVFFIFESKEGNIVKIPAHKNILSANSKVFDDMFYGPAKQKGSIRIVNYTPEVFKEFLKFFYLATVELTMENASKVLKLNKEYMVDDCCMNIIEPDLTVDNMCWGYELGNIFGYDRLKKLCELKISENSKEIFQSNSFLSCGLHVLRRILKLDSLNCDESVVFDGCIAWAKNACFQKGLDEKNMKNLRNQLGDLVYEIRFGDMTTENFFSRYCSYDGLFSTEEFKDIIGMIASKEYQPSKFNRISRTMRQNIIENNDELICDRFEATILNRLHGDTFWKDLTIFSSDFPLLLKTIHCVELFHSLHTGIVSQGTNIIPAVMKVIKISNEKLQFDQINCDGPIIYFDQMIFYPSRELIVSLKAPIAIQPDVKYGIFFNIHGEGYTLTNLKSVNYGPEKVSPKKGGGLVKKLIFVEL